MIRFKSKGTYKKTFSFLERLLTWLGAGGLNKYGEQGVRALSEATPKDSGKTAQSWSYDVINDGNKVSIIWSNSNVNEGVNIAVILQYGHGTGTGGYVQGIDYINPAMKPIFESIADNAWKELIRV